MRRRPLHAHLHTHAEPVARVLTCPTPSPVAQLGAITFEMLTGEPLVDLQALNSETAEFRRMVAAPKVCEVAAGIKLKLENVAGYQL